MRDNHLMETKEIGARLKSARLAAQLTQLDVAIRLKLARSTVSMIENGSRSLRAGELEEFVAFSGKVADVVAGMKHTSALQWAMRLLG